MGRHIGEEKKPLKYNVGSGLPSFFRGKSSGIERVWKSSISLHPPDTLDVRQNNLNRVITLKCNSAWEDGTEIIQVSKLDCLCN